MEIVDARNNEKQAWTLRPALFQSAQSEYDSSLVLLYHLAPILLGQVRSGRDLEEKLRGSGLLTGVILYLVKILWLLPVTAANSTE